MFLDTTEAPHFGAQIIELRNFPFNVTEFRATSNSTVVVAFDVPDREAHTPFTLRREVRASTAEAIYEELQDMVLHELAEAFHVDGERVYDPHQGCGDGEVCRFHATEDGSVHVHYEDGHTRDSIV